MALTTKQKQQLKAKAHHLKPIVFVGNNGVTETVKNEIDRCLTDHELIKIRIQIGDRVLRRELFAEIGQMLRAEAIHMIGNVGIVYRKNAEST